MGRIVQYEGPSHAKIYLCGEAPGVQEEMEGRPFVGGAGRILNKMLLDVGISRGECRVGNVMRVRPPGNNFSHFYNGKYPTPELEEGRRYLREDIKRTKPNVVCAMGNEALRALTGEYGVTNWRGSILWESKLGCKVVPTIHPAMIMRQWEFMPLTLFDLRRVKEEGESPDYSIPHRDFVLAPTFETCMRELERLRGCKRVAFDVETSGINLTAIAFADSPFWAISIPFTVSKGVEVLNAWTSEEEIAILTGVKELMEDEKVEKIAQNAQFDILILRLCPLRIHTRGLVLDTMCAHNTCYPELPKALDVICSIYTRQPYYKHWAREGNDVVFWKYNGMDACITFEAAIAIEKEMEEFGVREFYYKLVHPLIDILGEMQLKGVRIDGGTRERAYEDVGKETVVLQGKLEEVVGESVNVMSSKQLKELLYGKMGLPARISRARGTETTDEEALRALAAKYPSEMFDLILRIRHNRKLLGTYLNEGSEGRIRTSYVIGGTKTGRLSSRESIFGTGTNLQNIPRGVCRKMFIPDEERVFIEADLSQADARVVAYLAEEERMIEVLEKGGDIHQLTAESLPDYFVPKGSEYEGIGNPRRLFAKKHVHAFNYGESARGFAREAGIPEKEAREIQNKYFDTFPKIKAWQLKIQASLSRNRIMETPMGRKRMFFGRWGDTLFREAYAYVPQSTVADILNLAMIRLHKRSCVEGVLWKVEFMLQVHDAFVLQCEKGYVDLWVEAIKEAFNIPINIKGRELVIPVEIKMGENWDEMSKVSAD